MSNRKRVGAKPISKSSRALSTKKPARSSAKKTSKKRPSKKSTKTPTRSSSKFEKKIVKSLSKSVKKTSKKISAKATKLGKKAGKSLGRKIGEKLREKLTGKKNLGVGKKKQFSIKSLKLPKKRTFKQQLATLDEHTEELDALKQDNEYFGFSFFGNRSYQVFDSADNLIKKLSQYKSIQEFGNSRGKKYEALVKGIKIIKFKGTAKAWSKQKAKEVKINQLEKKKKAAEAMKLKRQVANLKRQLKKERSEKRKNRKHK